MLTIRALLVVLVILVTNGQTLANVLATDSLATPTSASAQRKFIRIAGVKLDPSKPIWVSYSLLALSASSGRNGEVVIEGSPQEIKVPITDTFMRFGADRMDLLPRSGKFAEMFKKQWGERSPEEMKTVLGPELFKCYEALIHNEGSIFGQTIVKTYQTFGAQDLVFSASVSRLDTLQPALLTVTIGQGDVPPEYKDAYAKFTGNNGRTEKQIAAAIALLIAVVYVVRKFKNRA